MSSAISFPSAKQVAIGGACGAADFLFCTAFQKTCMLAGVKFEEIEDEGAVPSSECLDKQFWEMVVICPIGEELVFRGALQPLLAKGLSLCFPRLGEPSSVGIPLAHVISAVAVGTGFGIVHYFNYKSGGMQVSCIASVSGSVYGLIKERFGLASSVSAHMVHNFGVGWLDKHFPAFLETSS